MHEGFLIHDAKAGQYFLGPALYRLGSLVEGRFGSLKENVRANLRRLVASTGHTAMFSVVSGQKRLILTKEEPDLDLRFTVREGRTRVITSGATGRVILAFAGESFREQALKASDLSDEQLKSLRADIAKVSTDGFGFSRSELTKHAFALSVPVLNQSGQFVGALSLAGPDAAYEPERQTEFLSELRSEVFALQRSATFGDPAESVPSSITQKRKSQNA